MKAGDVCSAHVDCSASACQRNTNTLTQVEVTKMHSRKSRLSIGLQSQSSIASIKQLRDCAPVAWTLDAHAMNNSSGNAKAHQSCLAVP